MPEQLPDGDVCSHDDCNEPTPWDMVAIVVEGQWFCSPACAVDALGVSKSPPETVTLHDPQYRVDRDELPDVSAEAVDITRSVIGMVEAKQAIKDTREMVGGQFREDV